MLSAEENELLTCTGPGSAMGDLMRQYWIPALMSSELQPPDGPPLRVRLLGENLIAFRSTSGQVGLLDEACPHRGASLFYGRNEAEGLRCVYHGWKFDAEGRCVEMPNEPADSDFKHKICAQAYPCLERGGIVWTYMGPRKTPPPLPDLEPNLLPEGHGAMWTALRECNWVQALEGDIDTAHLGILHLGSVAPETLAPGSFDYYTVNDRNPRYEVIDTDYGTTYGAYRPAEEDTYYWRIAHFLFPFYTMIPTGVLGEQILVRAWVPLDDEHTMFWSIAAPQARRDGTRGTRSTQNGQVVAGTRGQLAYRSNTSDGLGRWRPVANATNDYGMDREVQRTQSYTGIEGIHLQDQAITESMGATVDRTQEHLGSSDAMVIRTRRRLIRMARALREGATPPGVDHPELYRIRSGGVILPRTADWQAATQALRQPQEMSS